ncbi:MAG: amidohydrolase family protein, partial [bacterium]
MSSGKVTGMSTTSDKKFLLKHAIVFTGTKLSQPINDGAILVEGNTIEDVGETDRLEQEYESCPHRDMNYKLLMPGLINTHIHLNMSIFRGLAEDLPLEDWLNETYRFRKEYMDQETQKLGVRLSLAESIKNGVTTIGDMSFYQDRYSPIVQNSGIRAILYDTIMNGYLETDRPEKILDFLDSNPGERITPGAAIHAPYSANDELMDWFVKNIVEQRSVPTSIHLCETRDEKKNSYEERDMSPTEWLEDRGFLHEKLLAVHGVWLDDHELEILKDHDVSLSHNPESNMKLGAGIAPVLSFLYHDIPTGLGTDSAASNNDLDLFSEMDAAGKLQKVDTHDPQAFPAHDIVAMATRNGAKSIGMDDQIGTIEPGKKADLITVDLSQIHLRPIYDTRSHLVYSVSGQDVRDVWVDGEQLMKDRELTCFDERKLFEEINEANHRI